ncbi:hypothetical protein K438DRAFT_1947101 [Mycena galopus ATCC 62051]|nr:hypothetical protein K438DRAFT_1947101 [Mycena galopus ATCC 62051]
MLAMLAANRPFWVKISEKWPKMVKMANLQWALQDQIRRDSNKIKYIETGIVWFKLFIRALHRSTLMQQFCLRRFNPEMGPNNRAHFAATVPLCLPFGLWFLSKLTDMLRKQKELDLKVQHTPDLESGC